MGRFILRFIVCFVLLFVAIRSVRWELARVATARDAAETERLFQCVAQSPGQTLQLNNPPGNFRRVVFALHYGKILVVEFDNSSIDLNRHGQILSGIIDGDNGPDPTIDDFRTVRKLLLRSCKKK
jgi:hypothetical protein